MATEPLEKLEELLTLSRSRFVLSISLQAVCGRELQLLSRLPAWREAQQPRWRQCVQHADFNLSEALGEAYVAKVFSPGLKSAALDMVDRIEEAMRERIAQLDWMSPQTKQQAVIKLDAIRNKSAIPINGATTPR